MLPIGALVKRHPLVAFFFLAYALTWVMFPLILISQLFGLLGLFGPAAAAVIITAVIDGRAGVRDLFRRLTQWRVNALWYLAALGLPVIISAAMVGLSLLLGFPGSFQWQAISALGLVIFVLVVGEELGWRGFALPRMLQDRPALEPASRWWLTAGVYAAATLLVVAFYGIELVRRPIRQAENAQAS